MTSISHHASRIVRTGVILASSFYLLASPVQAETIRSFDVRAELSADRTLTITETIEYDFEGAERHGLERFIPVTYERNGASYRLRLSVGDPTMDGLPVKQDVTKQGSNLRIRLGDPDRLITGKHTYVLRYSTDRAINDFSADQESELYWNVTGDGWGVPIEASSFTLQGPAAASKTICFTGVYGSTEQACTITTSGASVKAKANRPFVPYEGFTVAVRYPSTAIAPLPWWKIVLDLLIDNIWLLWPLIVFVIMYAYWRKHGKEPDGRGTVIAQYEEPRGLPPGLLSGLLEQELSQKAITATLLDLARRGFMKVKIEGDADAKGWFAKKPTYRFIKLKSGSELSGFEKTLFHGLFTSGDDISLEEKKDGSFWKEIQKARHEAFDELKAKGFFNKNPNAVRGMWMGIAFLVGIFGFFFSDFLGNLSIISTFISAVIIAAFGWHMPQKTKEGSIVAEEAEGFKLFLSVTERDRLNFTDAPERKPEQFARFLPAAVAFGVEEKWGKQFADMMVEPPSYIEGAARGWTAGQYVGLVDSMHSASASSIYHNPSSAGSGGSGFSGGGSGGGMGGGGGGSW